MQRIRTCRGVMVFLMLAALGANPGASPGMTVLPYRGMRIVAPAIPPEHFIPRKYTCDGVNVNPLLDIENVPSRARSLVLLVEREDGPSEGRVHWAVWNIPPDAGNIPENGVPDGAVEGETDFGWPAWSGPCAEGWYRFAFRLMALDTLLSLGRRATWPEVEHAMRGHVLEQAVLHGQYERRLDLPERAEERAASRRGAMHHRSSGK